MTETFEAKAHRRDAADELARFRDEFYLIPNVVYMDGNSLGLLSKRSEAATLRVLNEWKTLGIEGWTSGERNWFHLAERLGAMTAPLLGVSPESVIVTGSTTANLHQLIATLYRPDPARPRILADALNFPSVLYALQSQLRLRGLDPDTNLILTPSRDGLTLDEADIIARMDASVQICVLPSVVYSSAQRLDMVRLVEEAHRRDILIGFDLAHSIGVIPHELDALGVDFAFWCNYKYLNSGPGASGGLYLNRQHFGKAPGLAGWFGSHKVRQFDMSPTLQAAGEAGALQTGTPNILSMAPIEGALELANEAGIAAIHAKSLALTDLLMRLIDSELREWGVMVANPREPERRGGHVAVRHPEACRIAKALRDGGILPDFRRPDIIRFAPGPLYSTFADCLASVLKLKEILLTRAYERYPTERDIVP